MSELLINIIIATISGFLGALILYIIQEYRIRRNKLIISDIEHQRIVDREIIEKLTPGFSIEKAKSILGSPLIHKTSDETIFNIEHKTSSYIYDFKNVLLKITSQDNISIDSTTVLLKYGSKDVIKFIPSIFDEEIRPLGLCNVEKLPLELVRNHVSIRTRNHSSCGLEIFIPNPLNKYFTYFCDYSEHLEKYYITNDIKDLLDATIMGVCISDEEKLSFFIYDYELR